MMLELTEQQWLAVQEQAGEPVEVIDPGTRSAYILLAREQYERMLSVESDRKPAHWVDEDAARIPPGILHSQQVFWHDLPHLLSQSKLRGRWVCYQGDERIGIGTYDKLIRECVRRRIPDDSFYLGRIRPRELPPWEPEDVEPLGRHHLEDDPTEP